MQKSTGGASQPTRLLTVLSGSRSTQKVAGNVGLLRKVRHRGLERVGWMFTFAAAAYNLVRIRNLMRSNPQTQYV